MPLSFRQSLDAILFASGGWFLYCICDAISKYLVEDYSAFQILAFSGVIGLTASGTWIALRYGVSGFFPPKWKWFLVRGLSQAVSSYCAVKAVSTIPLADFYGIVFLTPMATALLAAVFLNEKIGIWRIGAIAFGFVGVLIIAGPSFQNHDVGYLYSLAVVACACISAISIRMIGRDPVLPRFAFFPFLVCSVLYVPAMLMTGYKIPANMTDLSLLVLFSPLALLGLIGYSIGFARARETAVVAPFHYTQMIWGSLLGFVIFSDIPAITTFIGAMIIVASGIVIIWREHKHHVQIAMTAAETPI